MAQVTVDIPDNQLERVKSLLAKTGGDLASYVNEKVRLGVFWDTVDEIAEANHDLTPEQADELANEAVDWARANRP